MKYKCEPHNRKYLITLKGKKWFGLGKEKTREFYGEATVWHELPSFKRPGTLMESTLSEIWNEYKYEQRTK